MKKMRIALLMMIAALVFTSCTRDRLDGSGHTMSEDRDLDNFDKVLIQSVVKTKVSHGSDFNVTVRTDAVALSKVITYVSNNTLIIDLDENYNYHDITFEVEVEMPELKRIEHNGISDSRVNGFNGLDELQVVHDGVGNLIMTGSAQHLNIDHDGVGNLHSFGFSSDSCAVNLSGVGNVDVTVSDLLEGHLSGVGNIHYQGSPTVDVLDTGVGSVIHID